MVLKIADGSPAPMIKSKLGMTVIAGGLLIAWASLFITGLRAYPGSSLYYIVFSVIYLALVCSAFYRQLTYGYLFLAVFLWLGLWLKPTMHQIFTYPYGEPIGKFDHTPEAWDEVLILATIGAAGVLLARVVYGRMVSRSTLSMTDGATSPPWYPSAKKFLWVAMIAAVAGIGILNMSLGIQQTGLVPRTILIWPMNAVISWILLAGAPMAVATLVWWQLAAQNRSLPYAYIVLAEAGLFTVSTMSRAIYVFHSVPTVFAIFVNRALAKDISLRRAILFLVALVAVMLIAMVLVSVLRQYFYAITPIASITLPSATSLGPLQFVIDRWVGLEGLMAVSAHDEKGMELFIDAMTEDSEIGVSMLYQQISLSNYRFLDISKFRFGGLSGPMAFFYYSGSLWLVMLGMLAMTFFVLLSEKLVSLLTSNPLLSSFWGCAAANLVAQFGAAPRNLGPFLVECAIGILAISAVQSTYFTTLLRKLGLFK
jgi:hypothetical protein